MPRQAQLRERQFEMIRFLQRQRRQRDPPPRRVDILAILLIAVDVAAAAAVVWAETAAVSAAVAADVADDETRVVSIDSSRLSDGDLSVQIIARSPGLV